MTTPYEALGLTSDATAADIKAAYKRLAMKHHPERVGGSAVEFHRIKDAYEVLIDPEMRLQYDTTGTTVKMESEAQATERLIVELASNALNRALDPVNQDIRQLMRDEVHGILQQDVVSAAGMINFRKKMVIALKRFKRKSGENRIGGMIQSRLDEVNKALEANTKHQVVMLGILDLIEDYDYMVGDEPTLLIEGATA